jgi:DNA excision repair protein ERCC-2
MTQTLAAGRHLIRQFYPIKRKLIYCSRTVPEIEKALAELKRLMEYRAEYGAHDEEFRGLGLTSRKNLCLHPEVSSRKHVSRCALAHNSGQ